MNAMGLLPCHILYIYPSDDISPLWSDSNLMAYDYKLLPFTVGSEKHQRL